MKWKIFSSAAIFFILLLALAYPARAVDLTGPTWQVVEIGGARVTDARPNREPHVVFSAGGRVSGSTGCNRFTGTYQLDGTSIKFSPLAMTKMACPPPLDALERSFVQAMAGIVSVRRSCNTLDLLDASGKVQMVLRAK